ncbi:PREDICTED: cinnamoyl-CoA reductase 1-like isoform X2 [Camelina sativa]|uniref:Cinnamoyl-CoA reductase 1-like isoform X2 n=1 Tax=Camelina sativa TaxID=90675 RepID=A0ABM1QUJ0_CAMSA|nr:PREDICTED: cinnamoyl-CoA reductase 1-like isoform X2 [Camelina sativa]
MANSGEGKVVCVTGASGYIASWLVHFLLSRGYTVKASVRDPSDPKKTQHLVSLEGAKERLHLYEADLLVEGSFDSAIDGCQGVFHTASPCYTDVKDPQMWYVLSKTLAEDAAWKLAKEKGLDIVTINPAMVIGPLLQPTLNTSAAVVLNLINGAKTFPNVSFGWVYVKDVANAHIQAFEVPSANGRYCMVERVAHYSDIVSILHDLYPNVPLPESCVDENPYIPTYQVSKEKIKSLGIDYIPLKVSIKETVESLKKKGFVNF